MAWPRSPSCCTGPRGCGRRPNTASAPCFAERRPLRRASQQRSGAMGKCVLQARAVNKRFGGLQALSDVGVQIEQDQIYGLIGPNGAGKTTFFNVLTGLVTPDSGHFELDGRSYWPKDAHRVAQSGIARTFQNIRLFPDMTALENVMVGRHARTRANALDAVLRTRRTCLEEAAIKRHAQQLLDDIGIGRFAQYQARTLSYGAIEAVKGIDLEVRSGELVALIGANGAGKTSCLKAITGLLPWGGSIELFEQPVRGVPAHQLLLRGLALVPEGRGMFARMTVEENLQMGAFTRRDAQVAHDLEQMYQSFPRLKERSRQLAGTLSGGEQQMLALARALMSRPRLLLMDEPSMGLAPILVEDSVSR